MTFTLGGHPIKPQSARSVCSSVASAKVHFQVEGSPITRQPSFKWAQYDKSSGSPTKPEMSDSPHPSPNRLEHDLTSRSQLTTQNKNGLTNNSSTAVSLPTPPRPIRQESTDNLKSFKVSLEDPAWKVLPAALRKYKINNDDWQNYAMFICYGPPSMWFQNSRGPL
jgi:protein STE50